MKIESNAITSIVSPHDILTNSAKKTDTPIFDFDYTRFLDEFREAKNPYQLISKTLYNIPSKQHLIFFDEINKLLKSENDSTLKKAFVTTCGCFLLAESQFVDEYKQKMSNAFREMSEENEDPDNMFG